MKILKIKIKNINCLRGEWEIDFQSPPLSLAGLFAITGPTGSGKSTILDAITLALFNKIPRFESDTISKNFIERSGSIITRNETDSFVEVEYSCSEGIFCSRWFIAINKRGSLRETDMELIDVSTNKPILSGKKEVSKRNTELIGLTYDQFIKSILLSQGEFARFLKSKKDERGKLLEDITGMTVYRELGKRAFEKFKERNEKIKLRIEIIDSEEDQLLPKEKEAELSALIETINKEIQGRESNRVAMEKAIDIKNRIQIIETEIQKYTQEGEQVNKKLETFNAENAERIRKHEQLLPYLNGIRNYFTISNSIETISDEIKREGPQLENKKNEINKTLQAISKLINGKVEMQNADDALTKFRDRVIYLMTNKINSEKALSEQKIKISSHFKKPVLIHYKRYEGSNKIDELKTKICDELTSNKAKTEDLIKLNKISPNNISAKEELLTAQSKAWEDLKFQVENYSANREKRDQKAGQVKELLELVSTNEPKLEKLAAQKNIICLQIDEVRSKREKKLREKSFDEDRKSLKQAEPCPLCGSLHHPYVHEYINNISQLTKEFQKLEQAEEEYKAEIQSLEKQINMYAWELEALQKDINEIEKATKEQENKIGALKKQLAIDKIGKVSTIEAAIAGIEKSLRAIKDFEKLILIQKELEGFSETVEELGLRSAEFEKLKLEVEKRYKGNNIRGDCDLLSEQLRSLKEAIQKSETKISADKKRLEESNKEKAGIESSLNSSLRSFGYPDVSSSFPDILPDPEFNNLKQQLSDLQGKINNIKALSQSANERKLQFLPNDDPTKSKDQLSEELNKTLRQLEADKQNLTDYQAQKKGNQSRKNRIIALKQQVNETKQANLKWELLSKYIGDATGKGFSTFAQGLTLQKLIALANERLRKLNDRYLLDIPLEEEEDDLIIIDTYLGEERRSVRTLSGGETFIVSLALALALSDLASKNVKIESLYIDEGFGGLDPEALDVAILTLEQLQVESNKTIGIISHVESLKERIETQIQLEKNSGGFSKIVIK